MTIHEIIKVRDDARMRGDEFLVELCEEALPYSWGAEYTVMSSDTIEEAKRMLALHLKR